METIRVIAVFAHILVEPTMRLVYYFIKHGYPPSIQPRSKNISLNSLYAEAPSSTTSASKNSSRGNIKNQYRQIFNLILQYLTGSTLQNSTPLNLDVNQVISFTCNVNEISSPLGKNSIHLIIVLKTGPLIKNVRILDHCFNG